MWLVSYVVGPARGRPLLLGAALAAAVLLAFQLTEEPFSSGFDETTSVEPDDPFATDEPFGPDDPGASEEAFTVEADEPDATTLGIISLLFGAAYLVAARLLDRRRFAGTATPFVVVGLAAIPLGIALLGEDIEAAGAGAASVRTTGIGPWGPPVPPVEFRPPPLPPPPADS